MAYVNIESLAPEEPRRDSTALPVYQGHLPPDQTHLTRA
jgi:hypothetical protein